MTKQQVDTEKNTGRIQKPLGELDQGQKRQCCHCGGVMQAEMQEAQSEPYPWRERGIRFSCDNCDETAWIASTETIMISLASSLLIALGILYMLINGLFDFIGFSFESGIGSGVLSLLLLLVVALFALGAIYNARRGGALILTNRAYPVIDDPNSARRFILPLSLGLLPWLLAIGAGYLNYTFFDDSKIVGIIAMVLVCMPFVFAKKLGSSVREVFLAVLFWFLIGAAGAWAFGAF
ncbi:MAG: hypothetical protein OQL27_01325 [Sedimenticola sp.]|nr:hypothetical protein [Sedimenticola sp.]